MKKFICCLAMILAFSTVASPTLLTIASYEENIQLASDSNSFTLLYDNGDNSAFQLKDETGNIFEYVEDVITKPDGTEEITQRIFKISPNDDNKHLIEEKVISILETAEEIVIKELTDPNSEAVKLNKKDPQYNLNATFQQQSYFKRPSFKTYAAAKGATGGSYIAAIRWEESPNNNNAYAIFGTMSKTTTKQQWQYRDFKAAANNIVAQEKVIITGGLIGVTSAVWNAVKGGNLLSWELIKKIFTKLGKSVPVVGTILNVFTYINLCLNAKEKYQAIP
ncbi:hypothetical protein ACIQXI_04630 [Lysinibacillus sp. NPDC097195]|uniref:hypothetical protein n=1 Tax=Lysinibacillus sp. NPDC097195 TaxID=3364141 RepID=UPI00381A1BBA